MSAFYTTHHWRQYPAQPRPEMGWVEGWRRHVLWLCAGMIAQRQVQHDYENAAAAMAEHGVTGPAVFSGDPVSPRPRTQHAPTIAAAARPGAPKPRPRNKHRRNRARR